MKDVRIGRRVRFIAAAAILIAAFSACAAGVYVMKSRTPEGEITIDGMTEDWKGALYLLADEQVFVGFMNDHDYLYVCLVSGDSRRPSQLMREGLIVWFDPAGGTKKVLGIRFPASSPPAPREGAGARGGGEGARRPAPAPAEDEVEILRSKDPASERVALAQLANIGLELKTDTSGGSFAYELKIPLAVSEKQPVAVAAVPGAAIGIGFETGAIRARAESDDSGGEQGGGGRGGGMGGMGGMGGGRGGRGGGRGGSGTTMNGPKPISFWTEVRLAAAGKAAQAALLSVTENFR